MEPKNEIPTSKGLKLFLIGTILCAISGVVITYYSDFLQNKFKNTYDLFAYLGPTLLILSLGSGILTFIRWVQTVPDPYNEDSNDPFHEYGDEFFDDDEEEEDSKERYIDPD